MNEDKSACNFCYSYRGSTRAELMRVFAEVLRDWSPLSCLGIIDVPGFEMVQKRSTV